MYDELDDKEIVPKEEVRRMFVDAGIFQYQTHDTARAWDGGTPNYPNTMRRIVRIIASAASDAAANRAINALRIPTTGLRKSAETKVEGEFSDTL